MAKDIKALGRHIGLREAIGIGVGAIVGGGILALAGTAFATTGPSAVLVFVCNGIIALITALSFAELSSAFPQSGGTYQFAKRVIGVGAAFNVGWVAWFASIVAAALYAIGFAAFGLGSLSVLVPESYCPFLLHPLTQGCVAIAATLVSTAILARASGSGGQLINIVKIIVFAALIIGGCWAFVRDRPPAIERLTPFFSHGISGFFSAMGYTFIALQGFDLIAAVAGEVKEPRRVLPRAMLWSLAIALAVYIPLLSLVVLVGIPVGSDLGQMAAADPDTIIATAAFEFIGPVGFWLVMAAGILSMLSALLANVFAASRIASSMARDRTLPRSLSLSSPRFGTPRRALWLTAGIAVILILCVGDVARAGAAASLIFLIIFTMTHGICLLARHRRPDHDGFRVPAWPWLPILGGIACLLLALYQGVTVPQAGVIAGAWLIAGSFSYVWLFSRRARIHDAAVEAVDPDLLELRGRSPLVLVPIANPDNASALAQLATCITPPRVGRVLLLNVIRSIKYPDQETDDTSACGLDAMSDVLRPALQACLENQVQVEALASIAPEPWAEIQRVASTHRCASVLLGMSDLSTDYARDHLDDLARRLPANCVFLQAPNNWQPRTVKRVVIPIGGRGNNNALRARLLAGLSLHADADLHIQYVTIVPTNTPAHVQTHMQDNLPKLIADEVTSNCEGEVLVSDDPSAAITEAARDADLLILGLNKVNEQQAVFSHIVTALVQARPCPILVIGHRD